MKRQKMDLLGMAMELDFDGELKIPTVHKVDKLYTYKDRLNTYLEENCYDWRVKVDRKRKIIVVCDCDDQCSSNIWNVTTQK